MLLLNRGAGRVVHSVSRAGNEMSICCNPTASGYLAIPFLKGLVISLRFASHLLMVLLVCWGQRRIVSTHGIVFLSMRVVSSIIWYLLLLLSNVPVFLMIGLAA